MEVWDYSSRGKHELIGYLTFCLGDILKGNRQWSFLDPKKPQKSSGTLILNNYKTMPYFDFLDYL